MIKSCCLICNSVHCSKIPYTFYYLALLLPHSNAVLIRRFVSHFSAIKTKKKNLPGHFYGPVRFKARQKYIRLYFYLCLMRKCLYLLVVAYDGIIKNSSDVATAARLCFEDEIVTPPTTLRAVFSSSLQLETNTFYYITVWAL